MGRDTVACPPLRGTTLLVPSMETVMEVTPLPLSEAETVKVVPLTVAVRDGGVVSSISPEVATI